MAKIGYARVSSIDQNLDRQFEVYLTVIKFLLTSCVERIQIEKHFKK